VARQRTQSLLPSFCDIDTDFSQCCSPLENGDGGWGIFNSLFGWQNSATYGSVISYNLYWVAVILGFLFLGWKEKKEVPSVLEEVVNETSSEDVSGKKMDGKGVFVGTAVKEIK
jgi:high-affinity iron transporter